VLALAEMMRGEELARLDLLRPRRLAVRMMREHEVRGPAAEVRRVFYIGCDLLSLPRLRDLVLHPRPIPASRFGAWCFSPPPPRRSPVGATRQASMFTAPVPCVRTFAATVPSASGLRQSIQCSLAGFSAVPQPSQLS